jgi:hypothetical protein
MKRLISSVIIGGLIAIAVVFHADVSRDRGEVAKIEIKGKAKKDVKADLFSWNVYLEAIGDSPEEARESWAKSKAGIIETLAKFGLKRNEDFFGRPKTLKKSKTDGGKDVFTVEQTYYISTMKMKEAEGFLKETGDFAEKDISISSSKWDKDRYKIKDLKKIEEELIKEAIEDAKRQAINVATACGGVLVGLPSIAYSYARVLDANASEDSYEGGSIIDQKVITTVSASFLMKQNR